ncbi:ABC transporter permease [Anaerosporobacter faecicola]|uniref:ABC transporter permease n=1 Tax=Anaerosporobacter faecicola TaxID=2718714 RepID=UPI00143BC26A|nr:ABC transporter permease [Anaerosporobacter faecicola]
MKWNKMQFLSIFLLAFLGVFVYAGVGGEVAGIRKVRNAYNKETNLADAWIYGEDFTKEDLQAIKDLSDITQAQRRLYLTAVGEGEKKPLIHFYFQEDNEISKPKVVKGDPFDPTDGNRVWLDERFAESNQLNIGDDYTFDIEGNTFTLEIGGLFYSSEYTYYTNDDAMIPDFSKVGIAYASYMAFPIQSFASSMGMDMTDGLEQSKEQVETLLPFTQIVITTEVSDVDTLEKQVDDVLDGGYSYFITRESVPGVNQLRDEMKQHESMMIIFSVAFVGIAILAIITTMNRMVNNQRTQIGTMKALGMKKRKIVWHYLSYGLWLSAGGAALGLIIGPISLPRLFIPSMSSGYTLPEWRGGYSVDFFVVAAVAVVACTVTTYFSCRKVLAVNPAETLRPAAPKTGKRCIFEKLPFWNKLSFSVQYNLRDLSRGKIRCLMGFAGTLCCMALLVCSASMYDSFAHMQNWLYTDIQNFDNRVEIKKEANREDVEALCTELNGEMIMEDSVIIKVKDQKKTLAFTATEGKNLYRLTDKQLKVQQIGGSDFALTMKTAKAMGIEEGDEIQWHLIDGEVWKTATVTIINRMPIGTGITTTRDVVEEAGYDFKPSYIATDASASSIQSDSVKKIFTKDEVLDAWDQSMEAMNILVVILIIVAVLLALLILYNLGLLAYAEREKELATLKVVGFQAAKLRKMLLIQNTWLSILGIIAGTPAGLLMVQYMVDIMGDSFDMKATISLSSFLLCAGGTLLVSVFVSMLFSGKLKKLDMVSSLKGME